MRILDTIAPLLRLARGRGKEKERQKAGARAPLPINLRPRGPRQLDHEDWVAAWRAALNPDRPSRGRLYDLYEVTLADGHTHGCAMQRKAAVMGQKWRWVMAGGGDVGRAVDAPPETAALFNAPWFHEFCSHALDSVLWGYSLIELGEPGPRGYDRARLVPRRHVVQEKGIVTAEPAGDQDNALRYTEEPWASWLVGVGDERDLGLLLKVAPNVISKRTLTQYWDKHAEVFGMPVRILTTTRQDEESKRAALEGMRAMGNNFAAVIDDSMRFETHEAAGSGGSVQLYLERINLCNAEISKTILGQTMTADNGSSLSQSQTHKQIFDLIIDEDSRMLAFVINRQLLPLMERHGYPVAGVRFEWDNSVEYDADLMARVEQMLLGSYDVDPAYFTGKYGIPCRPRPESPADDF